MYRLIHYITLFIAVSLLQVLFFNNLGVSVALSPLIYVVFILLLPIQLSRFTTLMAGLAIGLVMDWSMGVAGVNSIATLFIAFFRPYLLNLLASKEVLAAGGVPSEIRLGAGVYGQYLVFMVLLHHVIFFAFESLSLANWELYAVRFAVSSVASILFVWLIARAFVAVVFKKI